MSDVEKRGPTLNEEQRARLFQHGLHEEGVFYNRLNFFLVFESLLFAATMSVLTDDTPLKDSLVTLMVVTGIAVSVVWGYAQLNKLVLLKTLEERAKVECPEFAETVRMADDRRWFPTSSANATLAYFFPALFIICWFVVLYILW
jgi:hypothetical protein